jgi:hypothetical protein
VTGYLPFRVWSDCRSDTQSSLADLTQVEFCPGMLERLYTLDPVAKTSLVGIGSNVCRSVWRLDIRRSIAVMFWYSDMWVLNKRRNTDKSAYNLVLIHPVVFVVINTN